MITVNTELGMINALKRHNDMFLVELNDLRTEAINDYPDFEEEDAPTAEEFGQAMKELFDEEDSFQKELQFRINSIGQISVKTRKPILDCLESHVSLKEKLLDRIIFDYDEEMYDGCGFDTDMASFMDTLDVIEHTFLVLVLAISEFYTN